jgi:hypothetical protein
VQPQAQQRVSQGAAGPHRRRDECRLGDLLFRGAGLAGVARMGVDAVGALRGEGDAERDQFTVLARDRAVGALGCVVEGKERWPSAGASANSSGTSARSVGCW